jgi:hypothetical protein
MFACFWLFGIHLISAGSTPSQTRSWLQKQRWPTHRGAKPFAASGCNPKLAKLEFAAAPTNIALMARIRPYVDEAQNLSRASALCTGRLHRRWARGGPRVASDCTKVIADVVSSPQRACAPSLSRPG